MSAKAYNRSVGKIILGYGKAIIYEWEGGGGGCVDKLEMTEC